MDRPLTSSPHQPSGQLEYDGEPDSKTVSVLCHQRSLLASLCGRGRDKKSFPRPLPFSLLTLSIPPHLPLPPLAIVPSTSLTSQLSRHHLSSSLADTSAVTLSSTSETRVDGSSCPDFSPTPLFTWSSPRGWVSTLAGLWGSPSDGKVPLMALRPLVPAEHRTSSQGFLLLPGPAFLHTQQADEQFLKSF